MNSFMSIDGAAEPSFLLERTSRRLHMLRVAPFGKKRGGSFWLRADLGCDYVIHQGSTIKEEAVGGCVGVRACVRRESWKVITAALMVIV